ncbi:AAA family ATPase [Nonomuraea sp. PA05]|uniref:KAP family P-loop NTPase fold protein n=1 Tax=Nonomuraea sp. PA05 TaxID=2604466 RepID=UPI0011D3473B|nr:P-loop NTPase fold protein [Nonomuraea sp. PA05]TYB65977.1 AAA family ATPase [Nonomuraea sp. PA05]
MDKGFPVLSDAPVGLGGDELGFGRYVDPLVQVITDEATETPFTIGVFGPWGSGKSSLLRMIDQRLAEEHPGRTVRVHFNSWVHRGEPHLLLPLLHTLQDTLEQDGRRRLREAAGRIGYVIAHLTSDTLLRRVSGGAVTLDKLQELSQQYAEQRGKVHSELRGLRRTLQEQADRAADDGARLVIFIDDLDRCQPHEIVDLLESVKLFLDLRHVLVILAVAKNVVDQGIAVKYREFGFDAAKVLEIGDEYLDKMVQLPLSLMPIDAGGYLGSLPMPSGFAEHRSLLGEIVVPNPRRIKRVLNTLAVTCAMGGPGLRPDVVIRLVVLRVQSPDLYDAIAARPHLAAALEDMYAGRLPLDRPDRLIERYGQAEAEPVAAAVRRFHRSQDYLRGVFRGTAFTEVTDELPRYLTMLGR